MKKVIAIVSGKPSEVVAEWRRLAAKQPGFTLIELLICIVVILLCIAGTATFISGRGSSESAEAYALEHAEKLGWSTSGIACAGADSDRDGYISCTVALEDGSVKELECGSGSIFAFRIKGCKSRILILQAPGR